MKHRFHPEALDEYAEATARYAGICLELGEAFVAETQHALGEITEQPRAWHPVEEDVRRHLLRRFPYGIYYTIEEDGTILIVAVMHMSRRPGYWQHRLRQ